MCTNEKEHKTADQDIDNNLHGRELPCDVILEILLRLPDEHLTKFKLVSKPWHFMISNLCIPKISPPSPSAQLSGFIFLTSDITIPFSRVIKFLINRGSEDSNSGSHMGSGDYCSSFLSSLEHPNDFQDCCNGLLLLACNSAIPIQYSLCNPLTMESVRLPIYPTHKHSAPFCAFLAFDPSISLDYRVVHFSLTPNYATLSSPPMVDIFWSETQTWSTHFIPMDPRIYGFKSLRRTIYFKGVLYKLSVAKFVICIDLGKVSSQESCLNLRASALEIPDKDEDNGYGTIGTSRGCLYYSNRVDSHLQFWVLDDGFKWVLKHSVNLVDLCHCTALAKFRSNYGLELRTCVFYPHSNEVLLSTSRFLFRYQLGTKSLERIFRAGQREIIESHYLWIFPYTRCPIMMNHALQRVIIATE